MAERAGREPKPLGDLLKVLVAGRGWGERMALGRLRDAWPIVVGEQLARRCEPARLARGVLTVRAEAGAWANELTLLGPSLAGKADRFLGGGQIGEVKVIVGAARGPSEGAVAGP